MKIKVKDILKTILDMCIRIIPIFVLAEFILNRFPIQSLFTRVLLYLVVSFNYVFRITIFMSIFERLKKTDEATPEQEAVASDHGSYIKEVMDAIRCEKFEYLACFDFNGNKIAEGTLLSSNICNVTTEDWCNIRSQGIEIIAVHNHPGFFDTAFSGKDFEVFLSKDFLRKTIVVTKRHNYILEKTSYSYDIPRIKVFLYAYKMSTKYVWLSFFSVHLWSIVVAHKTAKHFSLKFSIERIRRMSTTILHIVLSILIVLITMACLTKPAVQCDPTTDPAMQGHVPIGSSRQND